ncbi:hypothetical protein NKR23_g4301 [Pleurostoma richardsiae]|uniref:Uncharacterized protein n=1 Tax=Pleurostoma richardsiae TaxID=41990 RepID=A0AA38VVE2_9PEZI|nr:hypothetical protein NKR23_g4301 [Pleurostoma richardsiae]
MIKDPPPFNEDEPPPSYEEAVRPTTRPSGLPRPPVTQNHRPPPSQQQQQQQQASQAGPASAQKATINRQFPPSFSVYREGGFSRNYSLGEHQGQPLYAVRPHTGWSGQPDLVLHGGPTEDFPPLAVLNHERFSRSFTVTLPPLPGDRLPRDEFVRFPGLLQSNYTFSVEVDRPGGPRGMRRERFEWRRSHGAEVGRLAGASFGWKLVRMAGDTGAAAGASGGVAGPVAGDGLEVVAVWVKAAMSLSKVLKFEFTGVGATGDLGERWAVMAVMTALGIWDHDRRQNSNSAAS